MATEADALAIALERDLLDAAASTRRCGFEPDVEGVYMRDLGRGVAVGAADLGDHRADRVAR